MDKRQGLNDIIVTLDNVVPVVQQHEECLPHIKEKIDLAKRMITLPDGLGLSSILVVAFASEKALPSISEAL